MDARVKHKHLFDTANSQASELPGSLTDGYDCKINPGGSSCSCTRVDSSKRNESSVGEVYIYGEEMYAPPACSDLHPVLRDNTDFMNLADI